MPKKINWLSIRTAYVVKGWTSQKCADEFGVDVTTIKKRASKEGWTEERHRITTAGHQAATDEAREQVAVAVAEIRDKHTQLVMRLHSVLDGIEEDIKAIPPGRSRAETRRAGMEAFERAVKIGRLALGFSEGQSSVGETEETDNKLEIVIVDPEAETA